VPTRRTEAEANPQQENPGPDGSAVHHANLASIRRPVAEALDARGGAEQQSTVELTIRAQAGDHDAMEALCLRCLKALSRFAAGRLPPAARGMVETQDIVLEAVHRGMSRLPELQLQGPGTLIAYMRRILKNLIVDYVRSAVRRPYAVALDERQADLGQSPLERVLDSERLELYEAALERLKPRDAALVTLRVEEQLGHEEIAVELGLASGNAARIAGKRAVLRLAHEMSKLSRLKRHAAVAGADDTSAEEAS
jgi:RNA polymerase sigma factor (sigma-70 family)